jgi:hypothetical protein
MSLIVGSTFVFVVDVWGRGGCLADFGVHNPKAAGKTPAAASNQCRG